MKEIEGITKIK